MMPRGHSSGREATDRLMTRKMAEVTEKSVMVIVSSDGDIARDVFGTCDESRELVVLIHGLVPQIYWKSADLTKFF